MQENHHKTRMAKLITVAGLTAVVASFAIYFYQLWVAGGVLDAWASRENIDTLPYYSRCIMWCSFSQAMLLLIVAFTSECRIGWLKSKLKKCEDA